MKTAISYLRVSGTGQVDGDGFPRQQEAIRRYAKAKGLKVVEEFRDEGVSGTLGLADRPGLAELVGRLAANGVEIVLVEKADRLARDLVESELILRELRNLGVRVIEAEGGTDLTAGDESNPTAKLIRQVLAAVAEFEKSALVAKLRAARRRVKARDGRCEGRKPFGHRPGEADTLALIKRLRRKSPKTGKPCNTWQEIADHLNGEGRPSRTGKPWTLGMVREIVATSRRSRGGRG